MSLFHGLLYQTAWLRRFTGSVLTECLNLIKKTSISRHLHNVLAEAEVSPEC